VFIRTISVLLDSICYELYMVTQYSVPDIDLLSLIIAYQGDLGYQDAVDSADAVAKLLNVSADDILIQSTGVIGQRIKKEALLNSLPRLVGSLSSSVQG
jgi:hypothetical protein